MQSDNLLRLAMILSSGQAQNFKTNLKKLINLVLFDNFGTPISLYQIKCLIQKEFSLEFFEEELANVIQNNDEIIVRKSTVANEYTYELEPSLFKKIQVTQTVNIDDYIKRFLDLSIIEGECNFEDVKNLIYRFLYFSFNSDVNTVLKLMNKRNAETKEYCVSDEFAQDEAKIINAFLNWEYAPKNEFILKLVSSCFDYCMLTVKKDTSSYNNVFNGKEFFLDSNIIFRLAGFNNVERQASIMAFIKKCIDAGIRINYTNYTYAEIKNTIKYYVDGLKRVLGSNRPISTTAIRALGSQYANWDFYDLYVEWLTESTNMLGDYKSFRHSLEKRIDRLLMHYKLVTIPNYDTIANRNVFYELCEDFTGYKSEHFKNTYEGTIKVDINNYLYIIEKTKQVDTSSFMQLKHYFITADHCLTEWAIIQRPGTVPLFVLPSVWYSILLKYKGRTEEDYSAFCQFLNIRVAPEKDAQLEQKAEMLSYILGLNEEAEIKEQIIFDIKDRLLDLETNIEDPIGFAEESHQTIIDEKIASALENSEKRHAEQIKRAIDESEQRHLNEMHLTQANNRQNLEQAENDYFIKGKITVLKEQAQKIVKRNQKIKNTFWIILAIGLLSFAISFILSWILGDKEISNVLVKWYNDNSKEIEIISLIFAGLSTVMEAILKNTHFCSTDEDCVLNKLKTKHGM